MSGSHYFSSCFTFSQPALLSDLKLPTGFPASSFCCQTSLATGASLPFICFWVFGPHLGYLDSAPAQCGVLGIEPSPLRARQADLCYCSDLKPVTSQYWSESLSPQKEFCLVVRRENSGLEHLSGFEPGTIWSTELHSAESSGASSHLQAMSDVWELPVGPLDLLSTSSHPTPKKGYVLVILILMSLFHVRVNSTSWHL